MCLFTPGPAPTTPTLPRTGIDAGILLLAGGAMIVLGLMLVRYSRLDPAGPEGL